MLPRWRTNEKFGLPEGREDFHTLSWLAYANLMLGHHDRAEQNLSNALAAVDRNPDSKRVHDGYLDMRGRHILETGAWQDIELAPRGTAEGEHPHWVSVVGMSAANRGDLDRAISVEARLKALGEDVAADGKTYDANLIDVLQRQVAATRLMAAGEPQAAIAVAREAADMEVENLRVPSGPPKPMKPAVELYADMLLAGGESAAAIEAFQKSLQWIPQRPPSMFGLAKAADAAGQGDVAREMYEKLRAMPGANLGGSMFRAASSSSATDR